jgi:hypothetical protein
VSLFLFSTKETHSLLPAYKPLPFPYRIFNAFGELAERWGLHYTDLDIDRPRDEAIHATGLSDFGDPYYLMGLEKLLESFEKDAQPHFYGRLVMRFMLDNAFRQRLRSIEAQKRSPVIFQTELIPPLIITGLPRSGTTFLHRLLSADPQNYGVPFWQLYRPFAAPGRPDLRQMLAWLELNVLRPMLPEMDVKHEIRPNAPEESIWMMGLTFQSVLFWVMAPVTGYLDWLMTANWVPYYQEYGLLVHALQAAALGKRLVLKMPDHMPHLDLLLKAVPNAHVIQLHREPETCVLSLSSLFYSTHRLFTEHLQPGRLLEANTKLIDYYQSGNARIRQQAEVNRAILDIEYGDLIADPTSTLKRIYRRFGFPINDAVFERTVRTQLRASPETHDYSISQFQ